MHWGPLGSGTGAGAGHRHRPSRPGCESAPRTGGGVGGLRVGKEHAEGLGHCKIPPSPARYSPISPGFKEISAVSRKGENSVTTDGVTESDT